MAITVAELEDWLAELDVEDIVGIDDGGLTLRLENNKNIYIEIGGLEEGE